MFNRGIGFLGRFLTDNYDKFNIKGYTNMVLPIFVNGTTSSMFYKFTHSNRILLITATLITLLLSLKKIYRLHAESMSVELESSKINEVLRYRYNSRVIVPIECINEESILALKFAKAFSNDITAFSVCIDEKSYEKVKEDFKLLDTDVTLVIKYSERLNITEKLLKFIKSPEYNCMGRDIITIILPQFVSLKHWGNLSQNHTKSYIERGLERHINVVVMTVPSQIKD